MTGSESATVEEGSIGRASVLTVGTSSRSCAQMKMRIRPLLAGPHTPKVAKSKPFCVRLFICLFLRICYLKLNNSFQNMRIYPSCWRSAMSTVLQREGLTTRWTGFLQLDTSCLPTDQDVTFCSITLDSYMMSISTKTSRTCIISTIDSTNSNIDIRNKEVVQKENYSQVQRHYNLRQLLGSSHVDKESSHDEHNIDPEYSSSKRSQKEQQQPDMIPKGIKGACASERNTPFFPLCKTRARNHSPLSGHSIPSNESIPEAAVALLEHKVGDTAQPIPAFQKKINTSYNIQLEKIHMNSSNTNAENKNANVRSGNCASDAPFVKTLTMWSAIDAKEVLKELPQQPHYLPLL
ncbi:hypothetical protein PR202_ga22192 [Eleusine coracana subsp. coracana]|uniref:Uncharacterized protein n=1 Tax=Eleusine coracana subsp. coracana TaxID=191504 RepID=A0AAV5D3E7_ELECO|nr:hypothetical protein PR202_ga22192 [Eleusine coracana subsp. coracana]